MTIAPPSNILVVGATGAIGRHITSALVTAAPAQGWRISVLTSSSSAADPGKQAMFASWGLSSSSVIQGDVHKPSDVARVFSSGGFDTVVSCLGRDAIDAQIGLLREAEASGNVRWFLPSEYGTDVEYDATSAAEKPHQKKLAVRKYIRDEIKKIKCIYVVTGPYIDMFLTMKRTPPELGELDDVMGYDVQRRKAAVVDDGEGEIGFTSMPDVGKLVVAALANAEASAGKALKVQSFVTTPNAITAEFERQAGGTKWAVTHTSLDRLRELEAVAWKLGKPDAVVFTLRRIWAEGRTLYEKTDNEALGLKPEDMETLEMVIKRCV